VQEARSPGANQQGSLSRPIVISSAGIHPTVLKLVGEEHFDRSYVTYIKDLVPDWGSSGRATSWTSRFWSTSLPVLL